MNCHIVTTNWHLGQALVLFQGPSDVSRNHFFFQGRNATEYVPPIMMRSIPHQIPKCRFQSTTVCSGDGANVIHQIGDEDCDPVDRQQGSDEKPYRNNFLTEHRCLLPENNVECDEDDKNHTSPKDRPLDTTACLLRKVFPCSPVLIP